jgi:hypothetical protein
MPGTITTDLVTIDAADVITGWLSLGTWATALQINADMVIQGTNVVVGRSSASEGWALAAASPAQDLSAGKHIYVWIKYITWPGADTQANGGVKVTISSDVTPTIVGTAPNDGPSNGKTWYVGGKDTDTITGWTCYVLDPTTTPTSLTTPPGNVQGTPVMTGINRIGGGVKTLSTVGAGAFKPVNAMFDVVRVGTGLTINNGTSGAPVGFTDIQTADILNANAWGVVTLQSGVYYGAGKLNFGTAAQAAITFFQDSNQVLVYRKFGVANTFYEILTAGAAGFVTTFQLGTFVSSIASGGCVVKAPGGAWTLTASAVNTTTNLYASSFSDMRRGAINSTGAIRSCTFVGCGELTPNGAIIDASVFQNVQTAAPISGTWALIINAPSEMAAVTNTKFIACNKAIKITAAGTYTFSNIFFSGNTFDVENASTGLVTINVTNGGSTPIVTNTGVGSSSVVNNAVNLTVTVLDTLGNSIQNTIVSIYKAGNVVAGQELMNGLLTNASGVVTTTFNFIANQAIVIRLRNSGGAPQTITTRYFPIDASGTITTTGYTATFTMIQDTTAAAVVL